MRIETGRHQRPGYVNEEIERRHKAYYRIFCQNRRWILYRFLKYTIMGV